MSKILDILRSEYSSEYFLKKYTKPRIYPKVATSKPPSSFSNKEKEEIMQKYKRWYVYYSYINPNLDPPKLVRQSPVFYNLNRDYTDFDTRLKQIKIVRNSVENVLKMGFSPYANSSEEPLYTSKSSLDFALSIKENEVKRTTYKDYEQRVKLFKEFLEKQGSKYSAISNIDKKIVSKFLETIDGAKTETTQRLF